MVARWLPDDGRRDVLHFARVFEIFCESGARWPSDRGALRFARVLRWFRPFCRFCTFSLCFTRFLVRCLFEADFRKGCEFYGEFSAIWACPHAEKSDTSDAKVLLLQKSSDSVR